MRGFVLLIATVVSLTVFYYALHAAAQPIAFCVVSIILAFAVFVAAMVLIFRGMPSRHAAPPIITISPDSAQRHIALIWLVRAGETFILGPLALLVLLIGVGFVLSLNPFRRQAPPIIEVPGQPFNSEIYSVIMLITILLVGVFIGRKLIDRCAKLDRRSFYKKLLRVNTNSVSTFSLVFAVFSAHDFYQLMPAKHPMPGPGVSQWAVIFLDRNLWPIVFWGLWRLVYVVVCRVLEINRPSSSTSSQEPPIDPDIPEFPQKSPLIQM